MFNELAEKTTTMLLIVGAPLVTLFLTTQNVTDPVNPTKLFVAGGVGFGLISVLFCFQLNYVISNFKIYLIFISLFLTSMIWAIIQSAAPVAQNLYGAYGRNTAFLAYVLFSFLALGLLGIQKKSNFNKIILALQFAGIVNVIYCGWVLIFGDFLPWNNPYGNILGLFGNPDFASAFLGIFIASVFAACASEGVAARYRIFAAVVSAGAFFEIVMSHAIQGVVVTLAGLAVVGFFLVRHYATRMTWSIVYSLFVVTIGGLGILGTLQRGPFSFVYKTSVSLRGAYWNAGLRMGLDHPFTGVGMDTYGDWYRRARSIHAATVLPGPSTISNAAHNVFIDIFSYGGFPLLLSYLGIVVWTGISIIRVVVRTKVYDSVFVSITTAWICYELQSVISINQIGLAIWGWILSGAVIAYEGVTRPANSQLTPSSPARKANRNQNIISPGLVGGLGVLVGLLVAVPPLSADMKWSSALKSRNVAEVMSALETSYLNPVNSQQLVQAANLLAKSNLLDQAHQVALQSVKFNPDHFESWGILYSLPNASPTEKAEALRNLKRLDPHNPDVTK